MWLYMLHLPLLMIPMNYCQAELFCQGLSWSKPPAGVVNLSASEVLWEHVRLIVFWWWCSCRFSNFFHFSRNAMGISWIYIPYHPMLDFPLGLRLFIQPNSIGASIIPGPWLVVCLGFRRRQMALAPENLEHFGETKGKSDDLSRFYPLK